jgi:PAS domain S-box-containing protein
MAPERTSSAEAPPTGDNHNPRVLLFMQSGRDRELLLDTLGDRYRVETTTEVEALDTQFDCCVFDAGEFNRVAGTVQSRRDTSAPVFLPFVLLVGAGSAGNTSAEVWEYADDVIELPVRKAELLARISNLVQRRRTAVELNERERELQQTVADLKLKERAMDAAPVGITISEAGGEDNPLLYINDQYTALTGYDGNVLGKDCRFLQGPETDPESPARIRKAIDAEEPVSVDILNYRKNGQKFWNSLDIAPIRDDDGEVTQFVGFQTDITERKIKERRLEVLNRVLNHNLRNRMNVVEGYLTLLRDEFDDPPAALDHIDAAASDLMGLADAVQKIERTLNESGDTTVIDLNERLEQLRSAFEDRYPTATFDLSTPDEPCEVAVTGLMTAAEEAVENAVAHNESPDPVVDIAVTRDSEEWCHIDITDNGPGIPSQELDVLGEGETSLQHANRLGIWLMYWVVNSAGGELSVSGADPEGTTVRFSVPAHDG